VKLSIGGLKFTTHVIHKCLNPVWDASFDFDVEAQSMPDKVCLMFWDKDRWNRDAYLGTVYIPFDSSSLWADAKPRHFDDPKNEASENLDYLPKNDLNNPNSPSPLYAFLLFRCQLCARTQPLGISQAETQEKGYERAIGTQRSGLEQKKESEQKKKKKKSA